MAKLQANAEGTATELETRIDYTFRNAHLLRLALTHSSLAFEQRGGSKADAKGAAKNDPGEDNEQLEFLGDAVVGLVVTELLCSHFAQRPEGDLTRMRALLVSGKNMGEVGARLGLGQALHLGRGEEATGGRTKPALLANAVEALVAAVYLDAGDDGLAAARALVQRELVMPRLAELEAAAQQGARFGGVVGDWKSALQELAQSRAAGQPHYRTVEEVGSDHDKRFRVEVLLGDDVLASGDGLSKKAAQQVAAQRAYERLSADEAQA